MEGKLAKAEVFSVVGPCFLVGGSVGVPFDEVLFW